MDVFRWDEDHDPRPAVQAKNDWRKLYSGNKGILLEKSPPNTVRSLWLQKNFRPSRFLSIIRNPYAVCEGITRRKKNYSMAQAARHWLVANECMLADLRHIRVNLLIKYEDLVENPEGWLTRMEDFLGLRTPFDRNAAGSVAAHSIEGSTMGLRNLNDESVSRLSPGDIEEINGYCGDLMRRLGYDVHEK